MTKRTKKMDVVFVLDATGSMANTIQAAREKVEDLSFELHINQREADFMWGCICYRDPVDAPGDVHQICDLGAHTEELADFLASVKASGGGDGPEDFVGALQLATTRISWRDGSKRALIWIADAPAHGQRYCGVANHQEEEPKLEPLVRKIGSERYYIVALSLNNGADRTFSEMKSIYEEAGGPSFHMESFSPEKGSEVQRIADTMAQTTISVVKAMLG
jgi:Mg-chelatase subunit ChlD